MTIFSKAWARDTAERAVASAAEAVGAVLIVGATVDVDTLVGWASLAGTAAGLAVLKSIVAAQLPSSKGTASLVSTNYTGRHRSE